MIVEREQAKGDLSVEALCEALQVSPSGYYAWRKRKPSAHQQRDAELATEIEHVFRKSRKTYGSDRIQKDLRARGIYTARKRVARLMRERGLCSVRAIKRRFGITKAGKKAFIVDNLLQQDFHAIHSNEKWVTDTTYIATREGWLYLVILMDLFSRKIVGWAMGTHHDAELATSALDMAVKRYRPAPGLIVHSDRGSEFANARFHKYAADAKIRLSMSCTGNCYDNAAAESFFATLKLELVQGMVFDSRNTARSAIFDFIEVFYNRQRLHSGIQYARPASIAA